MLHLLNLLHMEAGISQDLLALLDGTVGEIGVRECVQAKFS